MLLRVVKDTRRDEVLEPVDDLVEDPVVEEGCYLCGEIVLPGPDYTVHLTTAHEEVHVVTSAAQEDEKGVVEDVIEDQKGEGDVIEDPVACYLCGETVLPGQDYKVHLATAHRLTKVYWIE